MYLPGNKKKSEMCKYESPKKLKLLFLLSDFNYVLLSLPSSLWITRALNFNGRKDEVGW